MDFRLFSLPVEKLSITVTLIPCEIKYLEMCEPIKPAPPVTIEFINFG